MSSLIRIERVVAALAVALVTGGCATCGSDRVHWTVNSIGPATGTPSQALFRQRVNSLLQSHVRYPQEACRASLEGTPVVRVNISAAGEIGDVTLVKSSGHALLDQALLDGWARARAAGARLPIPSDMLNGAPGLEYTTGLTFNKL